MNSLLITFIIFLVSLSFFHLPIIWVKLRRPDGLPIDRDSWKKLWECTDYLWLSFSLLGLVTAANEVTRIFSDVELRTLVPYTGPSTDSIISHGETFLEFTRISNDPRKDEVIPWFEDGLKTIKVGDPLLYKTKELFRERKGDDALKKLQQAIIYYREFLDKYKVIDKTLPHATDARILHEGVSERESHAEALVNSYLSTQKSGNEKLMLVFSPFLLAFGFAVRFAKVSARLFVDA